MADRTNNWEERIGRRLKLRDLHILSAVVQWGSMAKAATHLSMTQPAISQQVKILKECGIIEVETIGRERYCKVEAEKLIPAFLWLEQYQKQWINRIDSFEDYVNKLQLKTKT